MTRRFPLALLAAGLVACVTAAAGTAATDGLPSARQRGELAVSYTHLTLPTSDLV